MLECYVFDTLEVAEDALDYINTTGNLPILRMIPIKKMISNWVWVMLSDLVQLVLVAANL